MKKFLFGLETPHMQGALLWSTIGHIYLCIPAGILFNTVMSATEGFRILTTAYMT